MPLIAFLASLLVILVLALSPACSEEKKPHVDQPPRHEISELDAAQIGKLAYEQSTLRERARRMQLEYEQQAGAIANELGRVSHQLDELVAASAKKSGLDIKDGWKADVDQKVWVLPPKETEKK